MSPPNQEKPDPKSFEFQYIRRGSSEPMHIFHSEDSRNPGDQQTFETFDYGARSQEEASHYPNMNSRPPGNSDSQPSGHSGDGGTQGTSYSERYENNYFGWGIWSPFNHSSRSAPNQSPFGSGSAPLDFHSTPRPYPVGMGLSGLSSYLPGRFEDTWRSNMYPYLGLGPLVPGSNITPISQRQTMEPGSQAAAHTDPLNSTSMLNNSNLSSMMRGNQMQMHRSNLSFNSLNGISPSPSSQALTRNVGSGVHPDSTSASSPRSSLTPRRDSSSKSNSSANTEVMEDEDEITIVDVVRKKGTRMSIHDGSEASRSDVPVVTSTYSLADRSTPKTSQLRFSPRSNDQRRSSRWGPKPEENLSHATVNASPARTIEQETVNSQPVRHVIRPSTEADSPQDILVANENNRLILASGDPQNSSCSATSSSVDHLKELERSRIVFGTPTSASIPQRLTAEATSTTIEEPTSKVQTPEANSVKNGSKTSTSEEKSNAGCQGNCEENEPHQSRHRHSDKHASSSRSEEYRSSRHYDRRRSPSPGHSRRHKRDSQFDRRHKYEVTEWRSPYGYRRGPKYSKFSHGYRGKHGRGRGGWQNPRPDRLSEFGRGSWFPNMAPDPMGGQQLLAITASPAQASTGIPPPQLPPAPSTVPRPPHNSTYVPANQDASVMPSAGSVTPLQPATLNRSLNVRSTISPVSLTAASICEKIKTCRICTVERKFLTREQGTHHLTKSHDMTFCCVCFEPFPTTGYDYKQHFLEAHADSQENAACPICGAKQSMRGMYFHIGKAHLTKLEKEQQEKTQEKKEKKFNTKNHFGNKRDGNNDPGNSTV